MSDTEKLQAEINRLAQIVDQVALIPALNAEITRLKQEIEQLTRERDSYRSAALALAADQITAEDIDRYAQEEPGLPLDAFIGELEQVASRR